MDFDTGLNAAVRKLRAALDDDAEAPRYIETLPRRGYRCVAEVEVIAPPEPVSVPAGAESALEIRRTPGADRTDSLIRGKSRRRWSIAAAGAGVLLALTLVIAYLARPGENERPKSTADSVTVSAVRTIVPPAKSVAVLPFTAMSSGSNDGYFADGLTEEIINRLTILPDVLVTARTSAFHFKGTDVPLAEIAATLGVAHIVEGSVRRSGEQVRIAAQLIRAEDGFHLWSKTYERRVEDVFAVQTDIAESVADALGIVLDERQQKRMAEMGVRNIEAFLAFQRGQVLAQQAHDEASPVATLRRANAEFEIALTRKPDFAQAHYMHHDLYAHILMDDLTRTPQPPVPLSGLTEDAAMLRLSSDLGAAVRYETDPGQRLVFIAVRTFLSSDWHGLGDTMDRAFASWKDCQAGSWIHTAGVTFDRAFDVYRRGLERMRCDPLNVFYRFEAATAAIILGQPDEALRLLDEGERLTGPHRLATRTRIQALLALKRHDEAGEIVASGLPARRVIRVLWLAATGRRADAAATLAESANRDLNLKLVGSAVIGDRVAANRAAASIDANPLGGAILAGAYLYCLCGAPFDFEATPDFARQLREGGLPWPPPSAIEYPLKDW